jgi:hypothetical protein
MVWPLKGNELNEEESVPSANFEQDLEGHDFRHTVPMGAKDAEVSTA